MNWKIIDINKYIYSYFPYIYKNNINDERCQRP